MRPTDTQYVDHQHSVTSYNLFYIIELYGMVTSVSTL
jgi:hypothetical protein